MRSQEGHGIAGGQGGFDGERKGFSDRWEGPKFTPACSGVLGLDAGNW